MKSVIRSSFDKVLSIRNILFLLLISIPLSCSGDKVMTNVTFWPSMKNEQVRLEVHNEDFPATVSRLDHLVKGSITCDNLSETSLNQTISIQENQSTLYKILDVFLRKSKYGVYLDTNQAVFENGRSFPIRTYVTDSFWIQFYFSSDQIVAGNNDKIWNICSVYYDSSEIKDIELKNFRVGGEDIKLIGQGQGWFYKINRNDFRDKEIMLNYSYLDKSNKHIIHIPNAVKCKKHFDGFDIEIGSAQKGVNSSSDDLVIPFMIYNDKIPSETKSFLDAIYFKIDRGEKLSFEEMEAAKQYAENYPELIIDSIRYTDGDGAYEKVGYQTNFSPAYIITGLFYINKNVFSEGELIVSFSEGERKTGSVVIPEAEGLTGEFKDK